ncbi:hypothetical protein DL98DRAFT_657079 [Cadophora sp. DSE1049]|nr:hypothetical protein DL98DRAFT_657079 [Cadophora sp. DSE1049]
MQTDLEKGIGDEAVVNKAAVVSETTVVQPQAVQGSEENHNPGANSDEASDGKELSLSEHMEELKLWMRDPLRRVESNDVLDIATYEVGQDKSFKKLAPLYKGLFETLVDKQLASDLENYNKAVKIYSEWQRTKDSPYKPTQSDWQLVQLLAIQQCAEHRCLWDNSQRAKLDQEICSASVLNFDNHKQHWTAERREEEKTSQAYIARLGVALAGGLALLIPMSIMVTLSSPVATLSTTTACVMIVALALAHFLTEYKDIFAATAAYAAVLVVFVGSWE